MDYGCVFSMVTSEVMEAKVVKEAEEKGNALAAISVCELELARRTDVAVDHCNSYAIIAALHELLQDSLLIAEHSPSHCCPLLSRAVHLGRTDQRG